MTAVRLAEVATRHTSQITRHTSHATCISSQRSTRDDLSRCNDSFDNKHCNDGNDDDDDDDDDEDDDDGDDDDDDTGNGVEVCTGRPRSSSSNDCKSRGTHASYWQRAIDNNEEP